MAGDFMRYDGGRPDVPVRHARTAAREKAIREDRARRKAARRIVLKGFPVKTPFQSRSEVIEYLSNEKLVCLECGKSYKQLGKHLASIHKIDSADYKLRYGLFLGDSLVAPSTKEAMSNAPSLRIRIDAGLMSTLREDQKKRPRDSYDKNRGLTYILENLIEARKAFIEKRTALAKERYKEVSRLRLSGKTYKEIAAALGHRSDARVWEILKKGIERGWPSS